MSETDELLIAAKNGDRRALSKLLTCLEEGEESPVPAGRVTR